MKSDKKSLNISSKKKDTNTSNGNQSLFSNSIGTHNTSIGNKSMFSNTSGFNNTVVGSNSLLNNQTSINNTAIGYKSLENIKGNAENKGYNTALGAKSGLGLETGISNVIIGKEADVSNENAFNRIVIGANASGENDNSVTLGNSKVNQVNMSENKTASINCGKINVYNTKKKKAYTLPNVDGTNQQVLKTDGQGNVVWDDDNSGGSGIISGKRPVQTDTSQTVGASGNILIGNTSGALTFTLPAISSAPAGTFFTFIATSEYSHIIQTNSDETKLKGYIIHTFGGGTGYVQETFSNVKKITLSSTNIGDKIEIISDGSNFIVTGVLNSDPNLN